MFKLLVMVVNPASHRQGLLAPKFSLQLKSLQDKEEAEPCNTESEPKTVEGKLNSMVPVEFLVLSLVSFYIVIVIPV